MRKKKLRILILGGRGFVGRAIVKRLTSHHVFTLDRHLGGKNHFQGSILSLPILNKSMKDMDIVINLVGLTPIRKPKNTSYQAVHVQGVKNILKACENNKIKKLIHHSALGADKKSEIEYLRTKGISEELILDSPLKVNVFCPSLIIGKENELIQQATKYAFTCFFPKIPAVMQPIYRQDVASLHKLAVEGKIKERRLEIAGPDNLNIYEIVKKIHHKKGYPCIPIPLFLAKIGMYIASVFHLFGITTDQIRSLELNNTTQKNGAEKYVKLTSFTQWLNKVRL